MKRISLFVLFTIFTCFLNCQNLVVNPGFETWQKINKPTGWTTALACTKDSSSIHTGMYSCKQSTTTDSKELGQVIAVSAGNNYRLTLWYKNDIAAAGNGCRIWSNWKDADGNAVSDDASLALLHSGYLKSDSWKEYSADLTAPPTAAFMNLVIRTLPNSTTWWDDISFEESFPTTSGELSKKDIILYPNPAHNYLNINNIYNAHLIEFQSVTGHILKRTFTDSKESVTITLNDLAPGLYFVRICGKQETTVKKLIVRH